MARRQDKLLQELDAHISHVVDTYHPKCDVCDAELMYEQGKFSMIGTDPRGPRPMGSLKCGTCGHVMFFELPS